MNLLNSGFVMQQAGLLAKRLERESPEDLGAQVVRAWQLCVQRPPDAVELEESTTFIEAEGLVQFARAMLNANEFVFVP